MCSAALYKSDTTLSLALAYVLNRTNMHLWVWQLHAAWGSSSLVHSKVASEIKMMVDFFFLTESHSRIVHRKKKIHG